MEAIATEKARLDKLQQERRRTLDNMLTEEESVLNHRIKIERRSLKNNVPSWMKASELKQRYWWRFVNNCGMMNRWRSC